MKQMNFKKIDNNMTLINYEGSESMVTVPDMIDDCPVTAIGAKAFLSCKTVTGLTLPPSVSHIGDWAFAHMKQLTRLTLTARSYTLGKDIFLDCPCLQEIVLTQDTSGNDALSRLLASTITLLKAPSLFRPEHAGSQEHHAAWMASYDEALLTFLAAPDDEGFQPVFYGWFNDEDAEATQRPAYIASRRKDKVVLAFLRLSQPLHLESHAREVLSAFLRDEMFCPGADSLVWQIYLKEYVQDIRYAHMLLDCGCITPGLLPELLPELTEQNAEAAALFLKQSQEWSTEKDFFDDFAL